MLSYNDIISYKFEKAGFGGGYRSEDVDKFTMRIAADYQKLEQEKAELEQKLMALAEKVEEYREDEESLRAALLGAQKLGDSIIRESKQNSEAMLASARAEADRLVDGARRQIEREQGMLTKMQKEAANFKNRLLILYKQHLELISSIPGENVEVDAQEMIHAAQNPPAQPEQPPQPQPQEPLSADPFAQQGAPACAETPLQPQPAQPEPDYPAPHPPQPVRESRFGELQFGEGYDLSHK